VITDPRTGYRAKFGGYGADGQVVIDGCNVYADWNGLLYHPSDPQHIGAMLSTAEYNVSVTLRFEDRLLGGPPLRMKEMIFQSNVSEYKVKAGGLIIGVIAPDNSGTWDDPTLPAGLLEHLGYPLGANPSRAQIIVDLSIRIEKCAGSSGTGIIGFWLNGIIQMFAGLTLDCLETPIQQGFESELTCEDRRWLTLEMLRRSTNALPPDFVSMQELDIAEFNIEYFPQLAPDWRMVNELFVQGKSRGGQLVAHELCRHTCLAGPTPGRWNLNGEDDSVTITCSGVSQTIPSIAMPDVKFGPNEKCGGDCQGSFEAGRCEWQRNWVKIGSAIAPYEHAFVPPGSYPPPCFGDELRLCAAADNVIEQTTVLGALGQCRWPTFTVYKFDFLDKKYRKHFMQSQTGTPFDCFIPCDDNIPVTIPLCQPESEL